MSKVVVDPEGESQANKGEIFLEPLELEEIGEFEGANIAVASADFSLDLEDESAKGRGPGAMASASHACRKEVVGSVAGRAHHGGQVSTEHSLRRRRTSKLRPDAARPEGAPPAQRLEGNKHASCQ
jgi:hypothetical protein